MIEAFVGRWLHVGAVLLMGVGLFVLVDDDHLVKKVLGLNVFQTGVFLFFLLAGYRRGATPPIVSPGGGPYANPLPQTLMLTAIVVGVSVTALALALVVRINREYGTLRTDVIDEVADDE